MSPNGEVPEELDFAISADTQEEPEGVYKHPDRPKSLGGPPILADNSGQAGRPPHPRPELGPGLAMLEEICETNVFGAFAVIEASLPLLGKSAPSRIIDQPSTLGSLGVPSDPGGASRPPGFVALLHPWSGCKTRRFRDKPIADGNEPQPSHRSPMRPSIVRRMALFRSVIPVLGRSDGWEGWVDGRYEKRAG